MLVGLVYLAVRKRDNIYGLSAAIFLLTYFLVSNWIIKIGTIMGERLMYAPSLGLVILGAMVVENLKLKAQHNNSKVKILNFNLLLFALYFSLCILLAWYGFVIIDRNRDWKNESTLIKSGYAASPNSVVSLTNMAFLAFDGNDYKEASRWSGKALEIFPDHVPALFLFGNANKKLGNLELAESSWNKMLELDSDYAIAYLSLGTLYYDTGQLDKAEAVFTKGFELRKLWSRAFPLAFVKINLGKYDEAINLVISNFGTNPEKRELKIVLGLGYLKKGDKAKAEFYLNQVKDTSMSIEDYFKKVLSQKVFKISEY